MIFSAADIFVKRLGGQQNKVELFRLQRYYVKRREGKLALREKDVPFPLLFGLEEMNYVLSAVFNFFFFFFAVFNFFLIH